MWAFLVIDLDSSLLPLNFWEVEFQIFGAVVELATVDLVTGSLDDCYYKSSGVTGTPLLSNKDFVLAMIEFIFCGERYNLKNLHLIAHDTPNFIFMKCGEFF